MGQCEECGGVHLLTAGECHLCGKRPESASPFVLACACLMPGCDRESGDECEPILLCPDCV